MRDDKIVAGVVYSDWNGHSIYTHQAFEGRLTRQFMWTICDYPFNQVKAKRVTGMIPEQNKQAIKFALHLGFQYETRLKDAHPGGDILVYAAYRENCKWLDKEIYQRTRNG